MRGKKVHLNNEHCFEIHHVQEIFEELNKANKEDAYNPFRVKNEMQNVGIEERREGYRY